MEEEKWIKIFIDEEYNNFKNTFCNCMVEDFKGVDKEQMKNKCIEDPLDFLRTKYKNELEMFKSKGFKDLHIIELLKCRHTENLLNLFLKDPEDLILKNPEYEKLLKELSRNDRLEINYCEGIKKAINNLKRYKNSEIQILSPRDVRDNYKVLESCLPTESYIIKQKIKTPKGVSFMRKLKSPSTNVIFPKVIAVTHEFQGEPGEEEHLKSPFPTPLKKYIKNFIIQDQNEEEI